MLWRTAVGTDSGMERHLPLRYNPAQAAQIDWISVIPALVKMTFAVVTRRPQFAMSQVGKHFCKIQDCTLTLTYKLMRLMDGIAMT